MRRLTMLLSILAAAVATPAFAEQNWWSAIAGSDGHICLVTTAEPGQRSAAVTATEWLPREDAEGRAETTGAFLGTHWAVQNQEGCESFLENFGQ